MALKSKKNGDNGEYLVAKHLHDDLGYWVHLTQRNRSGSQPVDIIAAKHSSKCAFGDREEDVVWLLDAKYVQNGERFDFSDIQPNQIESMKMAKEFARLGNIGFAIIFAEFSEEIIYFLPFDLYEKLSHRGVKSIHRIDMDTISEWEACVLCLR